MVGTQNVGDFDAMVTGSSSYQYVGSSVNGVGDVNGDGYEDLGVCGYGSDSYQGKCSFVWGSAERFEGNASFDDFADFSFLGVESYDYMGSYGVTGADIDQDGLSDIMMGAHYAQPGTGTPYSTGATYLVRGSAELEGRASLSTGASATIFGDTNYMYVGRGVSHELGDVNGDGYPDIAFGAYGAASYAGMAWLFVGGGM